MKKYILILFLMVLSSCKLLIAGDFPENRQRLHEVGNNEEYCQKNPDKCIQGIPW